MRFKVSNGRMVVRGRIDKRRAQVAKSVFRFVLGSALAEPTRFGQVWPPMDTCIVALPGVLDSSLALTLDVLDAANRLMVLKGRSPLFRVKVLGVGGRRVITGTGLPLQAHATLSARHRADLVLVPGLNMPQPDALERHLKSAGVQQAARWVAAQHARGATVAASCVGVFVVAQSGLLDGCTATTTWWLAGLLRRLHPKVDVQADAMVTVAGRVFTAGAALAQMDLCLTLVTRLCGPRVADLVMRYLVIDQRPSQARYALSVHLAEQSPEVLRAEAWIRAHVRRSFTLGQLARAVGVSERTLSRRVERSMGIPPWRLVQRVRAEVAAHLLETTDLPLEEVADRVGYTDPSALRRVLRRERGGTARELRRRARTVQGRHGPKQAPSPRTKPRQRATPDPRAR